MMDPDRHEKLVKSNSAQRAAKEQQDIAGATDVVRHVALRDQHLPGLRTQDDHDHARCIHQLRKASLQAQVK